LSALIGGVGCVWGARSLGWGKSSEGAAGTALDAGTAVGLFTDGLLGTIVWLGALLDCPAGTIGTTTFAGELSDAGFPSNKGLTGWESGLAGSADCAIAGSANPAEGCHSKPVARRKLVIVSDRYSMLTRWQAKSGTTSYFYPIIMPSGTETAHFWTRSKLISKKGLPNQGSHR
jgi:hypothetical protein